MARGDSDAYNARLIYQNALEAADGNPEQALVIVCREAAKWYRCKGAGFDREGGPHQGVWMQSHKPPEDPILIKSEKEKEA